MAQSKSDDMPSSNPAPDAVFVEKARNLILAYRELKAAQQTPELTNLIDDFEAAARKYTAAPTTTVLNVLAFHMHFVLAPKVLIAAGIWTE